MPLTVGGVVGGGGEGRGGAVFRERGCIFTVNRLYSNARYNDKIRQNDNLTGTKPSLKRWQFIKHNARIFNPVFDIITALCS